MCAIRQIKFKMLKISGVLLLRQERADRTCAPYIYSLKVADHKCVPYAILESKYLPKIPHYSNTRLCHTLNIEKHDFVLLDVEVAFKVVLKSSP